MLKVGELPPLDSPQSNLDEGYFGTKADVVELFGSNETIELPDTRVLSLMKQNHVLEILREPQVQQSPHLLAEAWTGALLNYKLRRLGITNPGEDKVLNKHLLTTFQNQVVRPALIRKSEPFYTKEDQKIAQAKFDSANPNDHHAMQEAEWYLKLTSNSTPERDQYSEWDRILYSVASGEPLAHELLLVTWQASGHDRLFCVNPLPRGMSDSEHSLLGNHIAPVVKAPAQKALAAYCNRNNLGNFQISAPHLMLKSLAHAMVENELFDSLDITDPDYLLFALADDYDRYCSESVIAKEDDGKIDTVDITEERKVLAGLISYVEDCKAFARGNTAIIDRLGSPWRFLNTNGDRRYNTYLNKRQEMKPSADTYLQVAMEYTPEELRAQFFRIARIKREASQDTDIILKSKEAYGSIWAAISLRQNEPGMNSLVHEFSGLVKSELETYMLDGLKLLGQGLAPNWMKQIAYMACFSKDDNLHPFTDEFGSISEDKRLTLEAIKLMFAARINKHDDKVKIIRRHTKEHSRIMLALNLAQNLRYTSTLDQLTQSAKSIKKDRLKTTLDSLPPHAQSLVKRIRATGSVSRKYL